MSASCVRVEDAERLLAWPFDRTPPGRGTAPEQRVHLPGPVPVYITYLTARPAGGDIVQVPDVYSLDRVEVAAAR